MNLLITGAWGKAIDYIGEIENKGYIVKFLQFEKDKLPCSYEWVEGVIGNGIFLYHKIEKFVNLKYIQLTSAGFDRVPIEYIESHNIKICNARGVYSIPMAEFAITGVLNIYKQMNFFRENQNKHEWNKHRGILELFGKNVCIVGCGSVGTECAKRFRSFECNVIGVDLFPRFDENFCEMIGLDDFDLVLPKVDILILTLPLTEKTRYLMSGEKFDLLKQNAVIVNIARGAIIDSVALSKSIDKLGGAVLDVFEEEPLETNSLLWDKKKVIITPHNSFVGENNQERLANVIIGNLERK